MSANYQYRPLPQSPSPSYVELGPNPAAGHAEQRATLPAAKAATRDLESALQDTDQVVTTKTHCTCRCPESPTKLQLITHTLLIIPLVWAWYAALFAEPYAKEYCHNAGIQLGKAYIISWTSHLFFSAFTTQLEPMAAVPSICVAGVFAWMFILPCVQLG